MNVKNRTIFENDNLFVLRGMDSESIDLIYLDPPFNSNRDYAAPIGSQAAGAAFKDTWTLSDVDNAWHGEIADREPALYLAIHTAESIHGKSMKSYLIMMAVRLLEMKRVLKKTGSCYLHCDPTASHYLKMMMDSIFGKNNFRSEITWKRVTSTQKGSQHRSKRWGNNADILLYYAASPSAALRPERELTAPEILKKFKLMDKDGERYYNGAPIWRYPSMGERPNLCYEWRGFVNPHPSGWRLSKERLEAEYQKGNIVIRPDGKLERRTYLKDYKGAAYGNVWDDVSPPAKEERTGYPTQKPIALLERIIKASSNDGDVVLDPFCGCATTCVAAERLSRQWIGIDISEKAIALVRMRLEKEVGIFGTVIHRTDIPKRSEKLPNYRTYKHTLYGEQEGLCNGCRTRFPFRNMTVDHIIPRKHGGTGALDNLQLLCGACNSTKGRGTQAELLAGLREQGII